MTKIHKHFFFLTFFIFLFSIASFTAWVIIYSLHLSGEFKYVIIGLTLGAPILFIFAEVLYRYYDNLFTRSIYLISSYVGGLFVYWFVASVVLSIAYIFSAHIKIEYLYTLSLFLYSLGTLFFVSGILQALRIKVVNYKISPPTQYPHLVGKKFVLVADTHLGPINQEIFVRRVFKKILNQKPDAVLFSGDMFDSECYSDVESLKKEIKFITSQVPVFFTPGNHEQYGPFEHFMQIAEEGGMTVLIDEAVRFLNVPIFGLNFRQTKKMDEVEKVINENISIGHPSIVLNHEPVFHSLLSKAGAFLVVSGHTHNGQFWPGKYLSHMVYKKFNYGLQTFSDMNSITTSGVGTFGPPMRTFNTPEIVVIEFK